ncbi:Protein ARABIDILLO 1 [Acorus gramineus]|uniref:Protein ARABIDILLO 1 n=1 Tax=Acorus gramineus TaxID=55184 RepID=A0AAV9AEQ8_ACOGR|nr:Protein ARABIDILLO 1 [Acorus gramineus]
MTRRVKRKVSPPKDDLMHRSSSRIDGVSTAAAAAGISRRRRVDGSLASSSSSPPPTSADVPPSIDVVDWTSLPDDTVVQLFSLLNHRDRASLASTCRAWRALSASPCLWRSLDLLSHQRIAPASAAFLSARCAHLRRLRLRGPASTAAAVALRASGLLEISVDSCRSLTDAALSVVAARHERLQCLQIGPEPCDRITPDAVRAVALCCSDLRRLRLSGVRDLDAGALAALAEQCRSLSEVGFFDCPSFEGPALSSVGSLRFISVSGARGMKWGPAAQAWSKLPNLLAVDVSRTDVTAGAVSRLMSSSSSPNLKAVVAINCSVLEDEGGLASSSCKGRVLLTVFNDVLKGISSLSSVDTTNPKNARDPFRCWRLSPSVADRTLDDVLNWLEWVLSYSLLKIAESNPQGLDEFWLKQGAALLLSLMGSSQEEVQERSATGIAMFVVIDDDSAIVDSGRAEAVMREGGVRKLLDLARSAREGVQTEAAKAIANLSVNAMVAKTVAEEGGIWILADLARSMNRLVAEEVAGGLWNLSVGEEHKGAIAEAGGVKALVDLIFKWPYGGDGVLERAAGALANLAADDKCSMEVALAGGVHALVMLARSCKCEGVQEQAARALANLAAHGDSNSNNAAVGREAGALEALVQLTCSLHEGVRQEAAGALWNLSFDDKNREAIAAAGGVEALVALAQTCTNASQGLQERAAGALWGLSVSEANSIAIGREGGVAPLIALARSDSEDVHETAAGALWNLAFNPGNALRIVEGGGVPALVHLCSSSASKMARFMAALALAYMFDGRMGEVALIGSSSEGGSKTVSLDGAKRMALKHIQAFVHTFLDPQTFSFTAASSAPASLAHVAELARIQEAGHLRCSGAEIGRFVAMIRNPSPILRACAVFALLQFTIAGGRHAMHHAGLLQKAGAARVLRAAAAAATAPIEAKMFAKVVLRNLEHHQLESSL